MNRTWLMPCVVTIGLAAAVLIAAGVKAGTLVAAGAALACPLMMMLMMGGGIHRLAHPHREQQRADSARAEDVTTR